MPFASKPFHASPCKRFGSALAIAVLCALTAACSDDDQPAGTSTLGSGGHSAGSSAASNGASSFNAPAGASADPAIAAVTIQTPAASGNSTGAALSAAAPPLASPVIHTVN
ncbi:hypothetical protein [Paraburkholderia sp.]|jgi:hypothetical protein|uniref:hypothetical protein n=1 Tax=Paraburkholderia sp. TaxID=1926495 RepID=UPI002F4028E8